MAEGDALLLMRPSTRERERMVRDDAIRRAADGKGRASPSGNERRLPLPPRPLRERYLQQTGG